MYRMSLRQQKTIPCLWEQPALPLSSHRQSHRLIIFGLRTCQDALYQRLLIGRRFLGPFQLNPFYSTFSMSKSTIETLRNLSRENHDPRFPPEAYRDLPAIRAETEQKLRSCNAEIMRMECLLEKFYIEREALENQLDLVLSLDAPIRSLPTSLLQDILVETTSDQIGAFMLSKVCSNWRTVVAECPAFWTKLDMDNRMWRRPDAVFILDHFLSRSRQYPLSVSMGNEDFITNSDALKIPPLLELLTPLSDRWGSLSLDQRELELLDAFETLTFSSLKYLSLSGSGREKLDWNTGNPVPFAPRTLFADTRLRSVSLSRLRPSTLELPWERLIVLQLHSVTFQPNDVQMVSQCHRLEVLTLSNCIKDPASVEPFRDWSLPITALEVDIESITSPLPDCPNITTFNLHHSRSSWIPAQIPHYDLSRCLARYGDRIQTLSLDITILSPNLPSLISILDITPIRYIPFEFASHLDILCPNLHELSISLDPKHSDPAISSILSVFHARKDAGLKCLRLCLHIYRPRPWETPDPIDVPLPYDIASLRSLVGEGIQVTITHARLRNAWDDDPGEVELCEVCHVLDQVEEAGDDEEENGKSWGIQCHFFDTPQVETGDFGGRRWRPVDFWRFQWPTR